MKTSKSKNVLDIRIKIGKGKKAKRFKFTTELTEAISFEYVPREIISSDQDSQESLDQIKKLDESDGQDKTGRNESSIGVKTRSEMEDLVPGDQTPAPSDQDQDLSGSQDKPEQSKQPIVVKAIRRAEDFPKSQPFAPSDQDQDLNQDLSGSQEKPEQAKQPIVVKAIRRAEDFPKSQPFAPSDQDQDLNQDLSGSQDKPEQSKQPIVVKAIRRAEDFPESQPFAPSDQDQDLNQDLSGSQEKPEQAKQPIVVKAIRRAEDFPESQPFAPSDQNVEEGKAHGLGNSVQSPPLTRRSSQDEGKVEESANRPEVSAPIKSPETTHKVGPSPKKKPVSVYESRIEAQFEAVAKEHGKTSDEIFFKLAWFNKDLHGSWRSLEAEHRIIGLKEILKMIVGPLAAMPGAKAIARNRIKGFFQRLANQYGTLPERVEIYFVQRDGKLVVRIAADSQFRHIMTVDALVKELGS